MNTGANVQLSFSKKNWETVHSSTYSLSICVHPRPSAAFSFIFRLICFSLLVEIVAHAADSEKPPTGEPFPELYRRRTESLSKEGFHATWGFGLGKSAVSPVIRTSFIVLPRDGDQPILFWVAANTGTTSFRLTGPDHNVVMSWTAQNGELCATQHLQVGHYLLEIETRFVNDGKAIFATDGKIVAITKLDPDRFREYSASPANGFHWPYLVFMPKQARFPCLLVVPNNTGFETDDIEILREKAKMDIQSNSHLAERLGCALLEPIFPRPRTPDGSDLYLHALSRDALLTTNTIAWKRVDLQLVHMIADARTQLKTNGVDTGEKVMLWGFSAAGDFVTRFATLHPDLVTAVAGGGMGWPIAPVREINGERLRYPIGIDDLETFTGKPADPVALRAVSWFIFRGADDTNDPVDFRDCYAEADAELIRRRLGPTPAKRWAKAVELYAEAKIPVRLVLYPAAGHTPAPASEDVAKFFEKCLREGYGKIDK